MIHKEGFPTLIYTVIAGLVACCLSYFFLQAIFPLIVLLSLFFFFFFINFFRNPARKAVQNEQHILSPADGKVVVIEETYEGEYLKENRLQISVFMSPLNVHVNRNPVSGIVKYMKYHPGKYLVAWHPKSSTENERTTVVIETDKKVSILFRQIAGFLARRIVCYSKVGDAAIQGGEMGFIKFGSRVDVFLPIGTKVNVTLNQIVRGNETVLAELKN